MAILLIRPSERQTRVGMHDRCIFISHSAHDDTWTTSVRHAVVDAIEGMPGYRALVDERVFAAGDLWRPLLYQWLAKADAAVLFLSEPALASAWVRKEATILSWRELGSGVRIIPVLFGVRMKDVRESWPAVEIHESHAVVVEPGTDPDGAAREILSHFADLGDADDAMRGWVARVAALLESAPDVYLRLGAVELGLDEDEWRLEGLCNAMGHALLHTDIERAERPSSRPPMASRPSSSRWSDSSRRCACRSTWPSRCRGRCTPSRRARRRRPAALPRERPTAGGPGDVLGPPGPAVRGPRCGSRGLGRTSVREPASGDGRGSRGSAR
jgi:hypothetical protein